ncbi:phosphotransferase [Paenibacillus tundrae]|uniref:phosphotransferase n=1 Tax=Paenibacillus tundrae TaxID=528187 RepID=UPI0030CE8837
MHNIHLRPSDDPEQQLIQRVLSTYTMEPSWEAERGSGGMNNSTYIVKMNDERYVLRQYETHNDQAKIRFEHEVLLTLGRSNFAIKVPSPVEITIDEHTRTFLPIQDSTGKHKIVALFRYCAGSNPVWNTPEQLFELGCAAGALSSAMSKLDIILQPAYPPYYQIQDAYPLCTPHKLLHLCQTPPPELHACADDMRDLARVLPALFEALNGMEQLPHQLVHGDLNASNVLTNEQGQICAILDFEFATWDLRVMELAVPMSDLLTQDQNEEWMWLALEAMIQGFCENVTLQPTEREAIPQLILLRSLDVVMHFLSRMFEGTDEPVVAVQQIQKLKERADWMALHEGRLRELLVQAI